MTREDKAARVAAIITEMIDIKFREQDRKHYFKGDDEEAVSAEERNSLIDQSRFRASQISLAVAISDLFAR